MDGKSASDTQDIDVLWPNKMRMNVTVDKDIHAAFVERAKLLRKSKSAWVNELMGMALGMIQE